MVTSKPKAMRFFFRLTRFVGEMTQVIHFPGWKKQLGTLTQSMAVTSFCEVHVDHQMAAQGRRFLEKLIHSVKIYRATIAQMEDVLALSLLKSRCPNL